MAGKVKHMSAPFIKYTPDIESADPRFDENLRTVIAKTERYTAESVTTEGTGRAVRDAHAKGYGLVRAEVEILDQLPAEYAQGIYARPGRHDALIRFSNGSPHAGADARLGGATGLALKIFGIDGPTLLEDEPAVPAPLFGWLATYASAYSAVSFQARGEDKDLASVGLGNRVGGISGRCGGAAKSLPRRVRRRPEPNAEDRNGHGSPSPRNF
jgi:hypothetical protein